MKQQEQLLHQVWELRRVHQLQRHKTLMSRHTQELERQTKSKAKESSSEPATDSTEKDSQEKEKHQGSDGKQGSNEKSTSNDKQQGSDDKTTTLPPPAAKASKPLPVSPPPPSHPPSWPPHPASPYCQAPYYPGGFPQAGMGGWPAPPTHQQYMQMMSQYYSAAMQGNIRTPMPNPYGAYPSLPGFSGYPQPPHPMAQYGGASYDAYLSWYNAYAGGAALPPIPNTASGGNQSLGSKDAVSLEKRDDQRSRKEQPEASASPSDEPSKPAVQWWKDPMEVFGSPVAVHLASDRKRKSIYRSEEDGISRGPAKLAMKRNRFAENWKGGCDKIKAGKNEGHLMVLHQLPASKQGWYD
eukprot:CAMPEP_0117648046 /NCGR_PEP_ID=MMETSP0804-20121206/179_1 /TAXON_ID=1074897 /ORGANISM="Tetraselmis astigmatica, Strain CCMP880" /LENGTH=353 /DNA_ID=CAMNT_0005453589 /DNA_START=53 /DNA_END=1114 /DNA_ORIENTATION=-